MPKFRDQVRGFGQAGVPSTMKTAAEKDYSHSFWDPELRESLMIKFIREHQGERMTVVDLGKAAQYKSPLGANNLVKKLIKKGKIERVKRGDNLGWTYRMRVAAPIPQQPSKENVDRIQAAHDGAKTERTAAEESFLKLLDGYIWEFITNVGPYEARTSVEALRAFSKFMHNGQRLDKQENTSYDQDKEEAPDEGSSAASSDDERSVR